MTGASSSFADIGHIPLQRRQVQWELVICNIDNDADTTWGGEEDLFGFERNIARDVGRSQCPLKMLLIEICVA
jgi:hypothetical protein